MRLALCLTGFVRRAHRCVESLEEHIYRHFDSVDIYLATWNIKSDWQIPDHPDLKVPIDEAVCRQLYGPRLKKVWIGNFAEYTASRPLFQPLTRSGDVFVTNDRAKMLLGMNNQPTRLRDQWYVVKKAYEMVAGDYDIVMRLRADLKLTAPIPWVVDSAIHTSAIHLDVRSPSPYAIDDKIAFGSPAVMAKYFGLYDAIPEMYEKDNVDVSHAEHMVAQYLLRWGQPVPVKIHGEIQYVAPTED